MQGLTLRLVGQIAVVSQLWRIYSSSDMDLHPPLGGCYNTRAAPGSGVCREARGGVCVRYAKEVRRHDEPGSKVAESTTCQAADSGTGKCKTAMCNVWIGGKDYCSKCAEAGEFLIDGACVTMMIYSTHRLLPVLCCWAPRLRGRAPEWLARSGRPGGGLD